MSLTNRNSSLWTRHNAATLLLSGAGLAGIAGCAFNVSPGERLAATSHEEAESKSPVKTSALTRLLKRAPKESTAPETESATSDTTVRGRLFSAIVDRFPSRQRDTTDPFLAEEIELERQRAQAEAATALVDAAKTESAADSVAVRPKTERSDAELWKIFEADSRTSVAASPEDPKLAAQRAAPALDRKSLQERKRANSFAERESQPALRTRTAIATANGPSSAEPADSANPFSRFVSDQTLAEPATESAIVGVEVAKQGLRDLIAAARQHEQRGALHQAHQTALEAVAVADREQIQLENGDERPADLVRRIERRLQASTRDPFNNALATDVAAPAAPHRTSPFSMGRSLAGSLAGSAPSQNDAPASNPEFPAPTTPVPAFPKAPEWRGVKANSPVSLAVVEQPARSATTLTASPVRHADLDDDASPVRATGRLLPRNLLSRNLTQKQIDRPLAFANAVATEAPLLAPPQDPAQVAAIAPPPPLVAETAVAAITAPAIADEELDRGRGYGGWVFGGVLLAGGLWLLGVRGRNPFARPAAARR